MLCVELQYYLWDWLVDWFWLGCFGQRYGGNICILDYCWLVVVSWRTSFFVWTIYGLLLVTIYISLDTGRGRWREAAAGRRWSWSCKICSFNIDVDIRQSSLWAINVSDRAVMFPRLWHVSKAPRRGVGERTCRAMCAVLLTTPSLATRETKLFARL